MTQLRAVLCDMDGTLVDTEPNWEAAKLALAARYNAPFTKADAEDTVGKSMHYSVEKLQEAGIPLSHSEVMEYLVTTVYENVQKHTPWIPGATEFLQRMKAAGMPVVLVTQAWGPVANRVAENSDGAIVAVVSGDLVEHPKPHPQPYLLGAEQMGVPIENCIAIEDSPSGTESAERAGCLVIVVPGMHPVPASPRRFPVDSLNDITIESMTAMLQQA